MRASRLKITSIALYERPMTFLHPFRFGAVTVEAAPQAFVRLTLDVEGRGSAEGVAAEMMMPKWFDKNPSKSPAETIDDLRTSVTEAAQAYRRAASFDTAFGHHARATAALPPNALPALVKAYGPALIDKALLDALLKANHADLVSGLRANIMGLDARLTPDLEDAAIEAFLRKLSPVGEIAIRATIGLVDDLDALARTLASEPCRYFKIKLGGDVVADLARLAKLDALLCACVPDFRASLDANEQYDVARLAALLAALDRDPLQGFRARLLYIEQPLDREATWRTPLGALSSHIPFIIDEADATYDAFPRAIALGYRGVSSKSCKGLYKAILNAIRVEALKADAGRADHAFLAAEDLTTQAGLGVQQDTALVAALGLTHVERNGHHYVDGFGPAPPAEAEAFARAHQGFYQRSEGRIRLATATGLLPTASLFAHPGFASGAEPDWLSLTPLSAPSVLERSVS